MSFEELKAKSYAFRGAGSESACVLSWKGKRMSFEELEAKARVFRGAGSGSA